MKLYNFRLSHGLSVMFTNQGKFLCYDPNDNDRAARVGWREHTEKCIRIQLFMSRIISEAEEKLSIYKRLVEVTK